MYNIITLAQIQIPSQTTILTIEEFEHKYEFAPKLIKEALQQAHLLFTTSHQHQTPPIPPRG